MTPRQTGAWSPAQSDLSMQPRTTIVYPRGGEIRLLSPAGRVLHYPVVCGMYETLASHCFSNQFALFVLAATLAAWRLRASLSYNYA